MNGTKLYKLIVSEKDRKGFFVNGALKHTVVDYKKLKDGKMLMILEMSIDDICLFLECGFSSNDLKEY